MNATGLMAVSTGEGASAGAGAQSVRPVSAANRTQTTSGKNSFSDTFDALQKKTDAEPSKTNARDAAAGKTQKGNAPSADKTPSQDAQDVTADMPKAAHAPKGTGGQKSAQRRGDDAADMPSAAVSAVSAALQAALTATDADADETLDSALTDILERYGLTAEQLEGNEMQSAVRSLLQQVPAEELKNRNFLRMLSGEPLAQTGEELSGAPEIPASTPLAVLTAQLRSAMNEDIRRTAENLPALAEENAELLAQTTADRLIANTEGRQTAQNAALSRALQNVVEGVPIAQEAAAPLAQENDQNIKAEKLLGDALTAEENGDDPSPLDILAQRTMRREAMGQGTQQEERQSAGQQLPFARSETVAEPVPRPVESAPQSPQPFGVPSDAPAARDAASAAPAQETAPQRPQTDYEIPRQIVEQARLLRTLTDTQMVIRLKPEHLGELTLRVAVGSDGAVQASFHSDNAQVRNVIENSLVQLRQELNNQGLKVDRVGVYTGLADGQMPQGQGQQAWQQSDGGRGNIRVYGRGDADEYEADIEGVPAVVGAAEPGGVMTADGVDYRI